jgi:DNA-binding MarR family transcriptional regulator
MEVAMKQPRRVPDVETDPEACIFMARACLSSNLRKTERVVTRHYDSYLASVGITAVQLPMIAIIASAEEPSFRLLSEQLDLDRSTLSRNLALLREKGIVKIGPSSGPKPGLISLSVKGRNTLRRAAERWHEAHRELQKALSEKTMTDGVAFLKVLRRGARGARPGED